MHAALRLAAAGLALLAQACTEYRISEPGRTATEQLLFSTAVDRVASGVALDLPDGEKVFVDRTYVDGPDGLYLVAALRDRILREGGALATARSLADIVIEPRIGAISVDRKTTVLGVPGTPIVVPLIGAVEFPELALLKRDRRQGVVKLALSAYDAETGRLRQSVGPAFGFAQRTDWAALVLLGWQENDLMPDPAEDDWVGGSTLN